MPFDQPLEFDDPNSTISNILEHVRRIGVKIDFAPSKLKQVLKMSVCHQQKRTCMIFYFI